MFPTLLGFRGIGLLFLRLIIGLIFLNDGSNKLKDPRKSAKSLGWSAGKVGVLGFVETISGLALILGLVTQWAALALAIVMAGAFYYKKFKWNKKLFGDGGYQYILLLLAGCLVLLTSGAGTWAVDSLVF